MPELLRVYKMGNGRAINVTRLFPKEWVAVMAEVVSSDGDQITIKFRGIRTDNIAT